MSEPLDSGAQASTDSEGNVLWRRLLYDAANVVVGSLQKYEQKRFLRMTGKLVERKCVRHPVLYCCDFLECKNTSAARYGVAEKKLIVGYTVTGKDIICSGIAGERSVRGSKMIKSRFLDIKKNDIGSGANGNEVIK